jgi:CubicO group peptidase (beta-lactamase class C family)
MRAIPLFLFIFSALASYGQLQKEFDSYFNKLASKNKAMGSFGIARDGKVVYQRAFGYSHIDPKVKANPSTKYWIGSISKTFTATIILQMVHEGKLSLDDSLARFYPDWPRADEISIEHLLRHQSGIHNFGEDRSGKYRDANPQTQKEIEEIMQNAEMDFDPGNRTDYNNANYFVLSMIAEVVDSSSFAEIVNWRIVAPLQLQNTYLKSKEEADTNEAHSYYWQGGWNELPGRSLAHLKGVGSLVSTPNDLNAFFHALFQHRFFPDTILNEMIFMESNMGMGLFKYPLGNRTCYGHAGEIAAFQSMAAYIPEEKMSFALCLNGSRIPLNEVLVGALRIYFEN